MSAAPPNHSSEDDEWSQEDASRISVIWSAHFHSMRKLTSNPPGMERDPFDPRPLWQYTKERDIIRSILKDLPHCSMADAQGASAPLMGRCLSMAIVAGCQVVENKLNKPADVISMSLLAASILPMIEAWWQTAQDFVPQWLDSGTFDGGESPPLRDLPPRLLESAVLQDFLLASIILGRMKSVWQAIETFNRLIPRSKVLLQTVPNSVAGGVQALCGSLRVLLSQSRPEIPSESFLLVSHLFSSNFGPSLAEHNDLCVDLARKAWADYPKWTERGAGADALLYAHVGPVVLLINCVDKAQVDRRLQVLFEDCDFASLIAKCLYTFGTMAQDENDAFVNLEKPLLPVCKRQPAILKAALLRYKNYLIILDQLRACTGKRAAEAASIWERLGNIAGLDESVLRAEAVAARRAAAGGIVGCSWYKCVMYRQESDQIMHWCMGCKKVVYCGYFCKTRDWDEGHKDVCQVETSVAIR